LACHAADAKANRKKLSELTPEARQKANCRSYSKVLQRRGKLGAEPCPCGEPAENHHPDYANPRRVIRRCPEHHRQEFHS
jgi:hypothetical protein